MSTEVDFVPLEVSESESESEEISDNEEDIQEEDIKEETSLNDNYSEKKQHKSSLKRKWDEANTCPICLYPWSSTGAHQIASLKCGHLFGYSCITKWLRKKNTKESRCPCCNSHAIVRNVRKLYACNIKVEDNSQFESVRKEKMVMERNCQIFENKKLRYIDLSKIANEQLLCLKNTISDYKQLLKKQKSKNSNNNKYQFNSTYIIDNNLKSSRILAYDTIGRSLYVTKSLNPQNFGIVKIDIQENKIEDYNQLHERVIKDIYCHPSNGQILSCSFDKTLQIYSNKTKDIDICIPIDYACWSCCWSTHNENQIFAGLANNTILMYDIRNLSTYCAKFNGGSLNKPIHSLIYVNNLNSNCSSEKFNSGILGASIDGMLFYDQETINKNDSFDSKADITPKLKYQQQGSCISLSFDPYTQQILSTWRSSSSSGLMTNYNIDYLKYTPINHDKKSMKTSIPNNNGFISSYNYMKENSNIPEYPISFERRQEIYGYPGQKHLTRNIIFSANKSSTSLSASTSGNNNTVIDIDVDSSNNKNPSTSEIKDESVSPKEDNKTASNQNNPNLETFVCASDENSCSTIIWKCDWDDEFSLAHHTLYQDLQTENKSVVLDIKHCPLTNTHSNLLACLTGDQVFLYKK